MIRNLKILMLIAVFAIAPIFTFAQTGTGDTGEPPHPGDTGGGTVVGGAPQGAPIGNGTLILLTLAMAYAGRKVYVMRTEAEVA